MDFEGLFRAFSEHPLAAVAALEALAIVGLFTALVREWGRHLRDVRAHAARFDRMLALTRGTHEPPGDPDITPRVATRAAPRRGETP